jgi:hypothetical protein
VPLDLWQLQNLEGSPDRNFEALTRAIVRSRHEAVGAIRERRNQPGVEFFITVHHAGGLGDVGRVWGWSCKWFALTSTHRLSAKQRTQISESMRLAQEHVSGLTDFVLCLPERPAQADLDWYFGHDSEKLAVHLWTTEEYESQLDHVPVLREVYFGERVLTPSRLAEAHTQAIQPLRAQWVPDLHTQPSAEERLDRALLRPSSSWDLDGDLAVLRATCASLEAVVSTEANAHDDDLLRQVLTHLALFADDLAVLTDALETGSPTSVLEQLRNLSPPKSSPRDFRRAIAALRRKDSPAGLELTRVPFRIRDTVRVIEQARSDAEASITVVRAAAGQGKTHLSVKLTSPSATSPAGIYIRGSHLRSGNTLDDFVKKAPGLDFQRFTDLLASVNAAAERAGVRLPIVIDGLNEAERPTEWAPLLDELDPQLVNFPHVMFVVTLRNERLLEALAAPVRHVELAWEEAETTTLAAAYFKHFKIVCNLGHVPPTVFESPLMIRMFCEAANPGRDSEVGIEGLPTSLVGLFERYRQLVVERLAADPARHEIPADEIRRRLRKVARNLWESRDRRLSLGQARDLLDVGETNWNESLFRRLEEEGILFREGDEDQPVVGISVDRFAGYLVADALLAPVSLETLEGLISSDGFWTPLISDPVHSLAEDIVVALVGLLPRRFGQHLWRTAPAETCDRVLVLEFQNEASLLDPDTVTALEQRFLRLSGDTTSSALRTARGDFDRIWRTIASAEHPLNAIYLDRILRQLGTAKRDLTWTEWCRQNESDLIRVVEQLAKEWEVMLTASARDDLLALTVAWMLTSTSHELRDRATRALQRYGRIDPHRLFQLAVRMSDVDDLYVVERMLAAAFGAASQHQMPDPGRTFERALSEYLEALQKRFLDNATESSTHELVRTYLRAIFEFAAALHPRSLPSGVDPANLVFGRAHAAPELGDDDPALLESDSTLHMDFENYVIGSAIMGRSNYDYSDTAFIAARRSVLERTCELGWREATFGPVDEAIARASHRRNRDRAKIERYGKKYSWIGYYELLGRLDDHGEAPDNWVNAGRIAAPDIDPTFPEPPADLPAALLPDWSDEGEQDEDWLRSSPIELSEDLWAPTDLNGEVGDWLLVEGWLERHWNHRRIIGWIHTLLPSADQAESALREFDERPYLGNRLLPDPLEHYDLFGAEMPWSPRFAPTDDEQECSNRLDDGAPRLSVTFHGPTGSGPTLLQGSFPVPSFEFSSHFALRQLSGTLDLVDLNGVRVSATFSAPEPWNGRLLFVRNNLVRRFADSRSVVQVAWGERQIMDGRVKQSPAVMDARRKYENIWRHRRASDPQA